MTKPIRRAIGWTIILIILYFLITFLQDNWNEVLESLRNADPSRIWPILALLGLGNLVFAVAWAMLVRQLGFPLDTAYLVSMWHQTLAGKYVPGSIWMVAVRVYNLKQCGVPVKIGTYSVSIEQITVLAAGIFLTSLTPDIFRLAGIPPYVGYVMAPFALLILFPHWLGEWAWRLGIRKPDLRLIHAPSPGFMAFYFLSCTTALVLYGASAYFMIGVFGAPSQNLAFWMLPGILAAGFVIGYLSVLTPGGIGVREGVYVFLFQHFMSLEVAVLVAFSMRLWSLAADIVGILIGSLAAAHTAPAPQSTTDDDLVKG